MVEFGTKDPIWPGCPENVSARPKAVCPSVRQRNPGKGGLDFWRQQNTVNMMQVMDLQQFSTAGIWFKYSSVVST